MMMMMTMTTKTTKTTKTLTKMTKMTKMTMQLTAKLESVVTVEILVNFLENVQNVVATAACIMTLRLTVII